MQPDLQIVARRQHCYAPTAFYPPPGAGLFAMLGGCGHKHISLWIIQRHEIMLIFQRERSTPGGKWMPYARVHSDQALFGMMGEYSPQQAAQHGHLSIISSTRVDGKQPISFTHIIGKGRLDGIGHPASSVGCRDVVGLGQDHQRVVQHAFRRPISGIFDPVKRKFDAGQCPQTFSRNTRRMPIIITKN